MITTLRYGIGRKVSVSVSKDTVAQLSKQSMQEAIVALLDETGLDADGTVCEIRDTVQDPRAVIEVRKGGRYEPVHAKASFKETVQNQRALEVQVNRPHAGG